MTLPAQYIDLEQLAQVEDEDQLIERQISPHPIKRGVRLPGSESMAIPSRS